MSHRLDTLDARDRVQLVVLAYEHDLVRPRLPHPSDEPGTPS